MAPTLSVNLANAFVIMQRPLLGNRFGRSRKHCLDLGSDLVEFLSCIDPDPTQRSGTVGGKVVISTSVSPRALSVPVSQGKSCSIISHLRACEPL